jgi:hypothetical protein
VISGLDLLAWINAPRTFAATIPRADDLAGLLERGYVKATCDLDAVISLTTTSSAPRLPTLPLTAA